MFENFVRLISAKNWDSYADQLKPIFWCVLPNANYFYNMLIWVTLESIISKNSSLFPRVRFKLTIVQGRTFLEVSILRFPLINLKVGEMAVEIKELRKNECSSFLIYTKSHHLLQSLLEVPFKTFLIWSTFHTVFRFQIISWINSERIEHKVRLTWNIRCRSKNILVVSDQC